MNIFSKVKYIGLIAAVFGLSACENYVEEENFTHITGETYVNEDVADELVVGMYQSLRGIYKNYNVALLGTDIFTSTGMLQSISNLNEYIDISSEDGSAGGYWRANYELVANANIVINRYDNISWSPSNLDKKAYGIAQAKGLRALAFLNLVQQFGGVVLNEEETLSIRDDYERSSEEESFAFVISELEAAIPVLVNDAKFGRLTKKAAQHILADAYMTRAYKSYADGSDAKKAYELAETAIGSYDIRSQSFEQVFAYSNQENAEVLLSVQFGEGADFADRDNNKHSNFSFSVNQLSGIGRVNPYGRGGSIRPSQYFYNLFADNDKRDDVTLHRALIANEVGEYSSVNGTDVINPGDTVIYFPKMTLSEEEFEAKLNKYWVYQPGDYFYSEKEDVAGALYQYSSFPIVDPFPIFKKFDDENFIEDESGGAGHRDTYVYRVAETHLLAAEAYLKSGNQLKALEHINRVRERATGVANHYASINIDDVLNERALELAGEDNRWNILKRTGKLKANIDLYNRRVIDHGKFKADYLLRPIPNHDILLSNGALKQNPGY